jgi:hypothetical protein
MKTMSVRVFDGYQTHRRHASMSQQTLRLTRRMTLFLSLCWPYYAIAEDQSTVEIASSEAPVLTSCRPDQAGIALQRPGKAAIQYDESANCERKLVEPFFGRLEDGPAVPDRWRIVQTLGYKEQILNPYAAHNPLKGDLPVFGKDWFFSVTGVSDSLVEPRRFPLPVGVATTNRAGRYDLITEGRSLILNQQLLTEFVLYKGNTTFKPPDWEFRFIPVLNLQRVTARELGVLKVVPDRSGRDGSIRTETRLGIQGLFADKHLWNVSDRYDFDSIRVGIQPFTADFRGFLFQDAQPGIRWFGTRKNNRIQYNLAWFRRLEKFTNNGLNKIDFDLRRDDVFAANLYWQDLWILGHTAQFTVVHNRNRERGDFIFDDNGVIARPASLFSERFARDYDVTYLGFNTDGHLGRLNLTTSLYAALGDQTNDRFRDSTDRIESFFGAFEAGWDDNWIRYRLSALYATGDDDPYDQKAGGFDAIFENPLFAGADTSFWIRQPVPLIGGGAVGITGRNGVLNSLRSSKEHGQSNFINPGTMLLGVGVDFDLTPTLRVTLNANQIWFENTASVSAVRNQGVVDKNLGLDLSLSLTYRPNMIQNVVLRASGATMRAGPGYDNLFGANEPDPYSVVLNAVLTY